MRRHAIAAQKAMKNALSLKAKPPRMKANSRMLTAAPPGTIRRPRSGTAANNVPADSTSDVPNSHRQRVSDESGKGTTVATMAMNAAIQTRGRRSSSSRT